MDLLSGISTNLWVEVQKKKNLHNDIMAIITFIAVFVMWMLARALYLFDASNNKVASNVVHGTTIELVWRIVPSLILIILTIGFIYEWKRVP